MNNLDYIRENEAMTEPVTIIHDTDNDTHVLLMDESTARELALALSDLLDTIDPYNTTKQDDIAHIYESLMENFAFERGSFLPLTSRVLDGIKTAIETYTPRNDDIASKLLETIANHDQ